jgi:PhnB protein
MPESSRAPVRILTPAPYLRVDDAARAIAFYVSVFGATEVVRLVEPSGRVAHAELRLGDASLMLSDEYPEYGLLGPRARGGCTAALQLYVTDVDAICAAAVAAGGTLMKPPAEDPFGDRAAKLVDPCGHEWLVATRMAEVTPAEMIARFKALYAGDGRG